MGGRTVDEIAASARVEPGLLRLILVHESLRGHVERDGDLWRPTPKFQAEYGRAFQTLVPPNERSTR